MRISKAIIDPSPDFGHLDDDLYVKAKLGNEGAGSLKKTRNNFGANLRWKG